MSVIAISEHVENAGVHSGDATVIFPAQDLTDATKQAVTEIAEAIAANLQVSGPFNIQFIASQDAVKVIECNLRVSRSFPFVSKTMGLDIIALATRAWMGKPVDWSHPEISRVGVKVPQFSFNRLTGADILMGVEMQSTGEVACFGRDHCEAYLKGAIAAGFKMPPRGSKVLLSIGGHAFKRELKESVAVLKQLGFKLFGTRNTADFFGIPELRLESTKTNDTILHFLAERQFSLVINVTERNKLRCVDDAATPGYRIRRAAIEANVPIVTDIKVAKLLVKGLLRFSSSLEIPVHAEVDCFRSGNIRRLPGLIDVHVHTRDPGETQKEDFETATKAALAGGITMICAMPNTNPALTNSDTFDLVEGIASSKAIADYALFAGASASNSETVHGISGKCAALKMYLNNTHGPLLLQNTLVWREHIKNWQHPTRPICVHAEGQTLAAVLGIAAHYNRHIHVCHVSSEEEIELIKEAKTSGQAVTCEVAPHHLFLTQSKTGDRLRNVKPPLQSNRDIEALWRNLDVIDCFATDHAPHLTAEKTESCCPGFPGLQTALPLLLTAAKQGRLTIEDIELRYHTNPLRIFGLPEQPNTYIEVDLDEVYTIPEDGGFSKCG